MFTSAFKAVDQMLSPPFRMVLLKSLGLTIGLFVVVGIALQAILASITISTYPYIDEVLAVLAGLGVVLGFVFLMGPVTALFAGIFLDEIAEQVEKVHYPNDVPGTEVPILASMLVALKFFGVLVLVNVLLLTFGWIFPGLNLIAYLFANGYLLGREFFEMVGMRHMSPDEARALRRENSTKVLLAGVLIAGLAMIPFANLLVPLFATAFMVHVFKRVHRSSDQDMIGAHSSR